MNVVVGDERPGKRHCFIAIRIVTRSLDGVTMCRWEYGAGQVGLSVGHSWDDGDDLPNTVIIYMRILATGLKRCMVRKLALRSDNSLVVRVFSAKVSKR